MRYDKIAVYGGSFNPIHNGHIEVVHFILNTLNLDKLLIIPVGIPVHKENNLASGKNRMEMCRLAFKDIGKVEVLDFEVVENKNSYTYDTLLKIKEIYPNSEIYEIIGEDSGENFKSWKNYEKILKLSKLVILRRKGYNSKIEDKNIIYLENPEYPYSSTEIREKIERNQDIGDMLPEKVKEYIFKNKLYRVRE